MRRGHYSNPLGPLSWLLVLLARTATFASAQSLICSLEENPVETFIYNRPAEVAANEPGHQTGDYNNRQRRFLRGPASQNKIPKVWAENYYKSDVDDDAVAATKVPLTPMADSIDREDFRFLQFQGQGNATVKNNSTVELRECDCALQSRFPDHKFYCPLDKSYCWLPPSSSRTPMCLNVNRRHEIAQNEWPFVVASVVLMLLCLICTPRGLDTLRFAVSCLFPCCFCNQLYARYLLRHDSHRARTMIRNWVDRRRVRLEQRYQEILQAEGQGQLGQDEVITETEAAAQDREHARSDPNSPTTVVLDDFEEAMVQQSHIEYKQNRSILRLKTCIFGDANRDHPAAAVMCSGLLPEEEDEEANDDLKHSTSCTICFGPIENGDVVGDLPCHHVFHKDCLKVWLMRRNVCPLCLCPDIATSPVPQHLKPQDKSMSG